MLDPERMKMELVEGFRSWVEAITMQEHGDNPSGDSEETVKERPKKDPRLSPSQRVLRSTGR